MKGKRVLVRVDLNVPMADGKVTDDTRIRARRADHHARSRRRAARSILLAHFGRPKGGPDPRSRSSRSSPALSAVIGRPVTFAEDCIGAEGRKPRSPR